MGRGRAPCCDKTQVKKGPWSPAEDLRLINFVQRNGHDNWRSLPKLAGLARCGKSCRLRWINYLHPDVKRGNFSFDEEDTIIRLHESMGNKWAKIASCLPGRTDNEIKNVWNTHLKKRAKHMKKLKEEGDHQSSSKNVSASTSSSSLASSSSSSSCKNPSCEQNIKDHIVKDLSDGSSSLSSSIMSCDESNVVTNLKSSCDDHNKTTSPSPSEEVNKPLEADFDFWSMLDMDNLGCNYFQSNDGDMGFVGDYCSKEDEQKKWLKNLETELGLEVMCDDDDLLMMKPKEDDHVLGNLVNSQVWPSPRDSYII